MTYWNDFNNTEEQNNYDIIPNGTIAKVKMTIRPGGYNDEAQGLLDGYPSKSIITDNIYLDVEFVILEGKYAKRKIWGVIGLYSQNGPEWTNMGRQFMKSILNSAKGILPKDNSETAVTARNINSFAELDNIEFVARIDVTKDQQGNSRNEIRAAITADHKDYAAVMNNAQQSVSNSNRPSWA